MIHEAWVRGIDKQGKFPYSEFKGYVSGADPIDGFKRLIRDKLWDLRNFDEENVTWFEESIFFRKTTLKLNEKRR